MQEEALHFNVEEDDEMESSEPNLSVWLLW